MSTGNNLECRYLSWGDFNKFRQIPLADNEALIYTNPIGDRPTLIRGFLDCIRSEELKARLPKQFSENDLAASMVEMVRNLPDSLIAQFKDWCDAQKFADTTVIAAVISW